MALFATQYPNNSRTVIGTPVLFNDDSILLCDTTLAPVTINLLEIPDGYWNTPWKLYVADKTSNASVNNITINAGAGQTINGASSITLSLNGECALIRIIGDNKYVAVLSGSGTTVGGHIIQDEGVSLPQRLYLNFIGPGVVASDNPGTGKTDVTIGGGVITVTYAQLTTLANTNSLIVGNLYLITDAIFGSTPPIPTSVVVTAITTNKVSLQGEGIFFDADYQAYGDYSGIPTFNSNLGIWSSSLIVAIGDVCIWSNFMYLNTTGVNTLVNPQTDTVNWQAIPYSITKGYILRINTVEYQQSTNLILSRRDDTLNFVERSIGRTFNSLNRFPWGNFGARFNSVVQGSCIDICNSIITVGLTGNVFIGSEIRFGGPDFPANINLMRKNVFTNCTGGKMSFGVNNFEENIITDTLIDFTYNTGIIAKNNIFNVRWTLGTYDGTFENNEIKNSNLGIANTTVTGDFSNNVISDSSFEINGTNNGSITHNRVLSNSSVVMLNNNGTIGRFVPKGGGNVIEQDSLLQLETNNGVIYGNTLHSKTQVIISVNIGFSDNHWHSVTFNLGNSTGGVAKTTAYGVSFTASNLTQGISGGIVNYGVYKGISTIAYNLDCSDPAIYDAGTNTLTIPGTIAQFFGYYELQNAGGITIDKIQNLNAAFSTQFVNDAGVTTFNSVPVGVAVADEIISSLGLTSFVITYRLNGTDSISLQLNGTYCAVTETLIYI